MDKQIFRKVAVDRLSSPDQLDRVMTVVPAKNWLALVLFFLFIALLTAWGLGEEITRQIEGEGSFSIPENHATAQSYVVALFSSDDGAKINEGMDAAVKPASKDDAWLRGQVQAIRQTTGAYEVRIAFPAQEAERISGRAEGDVCRVRIITERFKPIKLLLP